MIEAPNEWDLFSGWSPSWAGETRSYQERLWHAVHADPRLRPIPVVGPSLVGWDSRDKLGSLSGRLDYGNLHSYSGGRPPEGNLDDELRLAAKVAGRQPVVATEAGYHNATSSAGGHPAVPEAVAAEYLPRLFLEYFRRGIVRTYTYELVDEWPGQALKNPEASFGLLRSDFARKPAFAAVRNLIAILADPGARVPPAGVPLTVTGGPSDLRRLVLRKRDGRVDVVLWRAGSIWDTARRARLAVARVPVTVAFGHRIGGVRSFAPARSARGSDLRVARGAVAVRVGSSPVVLEARRGSR
jgi:hypothetical protein